MSNDKQNHPFYNWVPRPVGIIVLLLMFIPPTFSGGAYISNLNEMAGGLGGWTEDIQLASFFTSIGMCLFPPFMIQFLQVRRTKQTYLYCFLALILLNYICAVTTSLPILLAACLLTGFVRVIVMLNCTFTIAPYLTGMDTLAMFTMKEEPSAEVQYTLERKRTFLMPVLYFYILLIAQLSNMVTAWFTYEYNWQDAYYVVIGMLLVAILLVICTMYDEKKTAPYKVEWKLVPDMILMTIALCCMDYMLVYGKTLDWLDSMNIRWALAILLISTGGFLYIGIRHRKYYYLPLKVFTYRNVWIAILLFLLAMIFNSSSMFIGIFAKLATPINNMQSAFLSKWAIAGLFIGLLLSILLVVKKVRFRTLFLIAFLLMALSNVYMYFQYQSIGLFNNMIFPTILNYAGLVMLYSLVAAFGMKKLPSRYLVTFVFIIIWMRNAIAPVVGSSIYSNWFNERQQYYVSRLAQDVSLEKPLTATSFMQAKQMGLAQGKTTLEAEQLSITSLKGKVTVQATLVAMKDITGCTIWLLLGTSVLVMVLPYHKNETT